MNKGSSALEKIAELEAPTQYSTHHEKEDEGKPPVFISTPPDITCAENAMAHFECRLQPINDYSMKVRSMFEYDV